MRRWIAVLVAGSLVVAGTAAGARLSGTPGPDVISGTARGDTINGLAGNDVINGKPGRDFLFGQRGDDTLRGQPGPDVLRGGPGDDTLLGGPGNDGAFGGPGDDRIDGGLGADRLVGQVGDDRIDALDGRRDRSINCGPGDDVVRADRRDPVSRNCEIVSDPRDAGRAVLAKGSLDSGTRTRDDGGVRAWVTFSVRNTSKREQLSDVRYRVTWLDAGGGTIGVRTVVPRPMPPKRTTQLGVHFDVPDSAPLIGSVRVEKVDNGASTRHRDAIALRGEIVNGRLWITSRRPGGRSGRAPSSTLRVVWRDADGQPVDVSSARILGIPFRADGRGQRFTSPFPPPRGAVAAEVSLSDLFE